MTVSPWSSTARKADSSDDSRLKRFKKPLTPSVCLDSAYGWGLLPVVLSDALNVDNTFKSDNV